jgi:uncharacterized repeat protein (TIGR03803 family)
MKRIANPAAFVLCAAAIALPAQTITTLHSFGGPDGAYPGAGLMQAANGDFYGATGNGGANGNHGTIFTISPSGAFTTLGPRVDCRPKNVRG